MTTHSAHPGYHISTKPTAIAGAGTALAAGAVFALTSWMSTDGVTQAPSQDPAPVVNTEGARDSWEGRIGPKGDPYAGGVRDSWMPSGTTDRG